MQTSDAGQLPDAEIAGYLRRIAMMDKRNGKWPCSCATCQERLTDKDGPRKPCLLGMKWYT